VKNITTIGLDLAKNFFQVHGVDERGKAVLRKALKRMIPLSESHLRSILKSWVGHYNGGRPHMALGPGVPDPPAITKAIPEPSSRHRRGESYAVRAASVLGGLHHEYSLAPAGV
jgi:putative transposase